MAGDRSFVPDLTQRQQQVVALLERGLTNKEIAASLGIGPEGVKAHVSRLLLRFGARNRVALVTALKTTTRTRDRDHAASSRSLATISAGLTPNAPAPGPSSEVSSPDVRTYEERVDRIMGSVAGYASGSVLARLGELREALGAIKLAVELAGALPPGTVDKVLLDAIRSRTNEAVAAVTQLNEAMRVDLTQPVRPSEARASRAKSQDPPRTSARARRRKGTRAGAARFS